MDVQGGCIVFRTVLWMFRGLYAVIEIIWR